MGNIQNYVVHEGTVQCDPSVWCGYRGPSWKGRQMGLRVEGLLEALNLAMVSARLVVGVRKVARGG